MSELVVDPLPHCHNSSNCSVDHYSEFALSVTIWKYGSPTLLLVGTMGNMLSILVLSRKRLRQLTTMFYLTVLAIADLAVLYTGLLRLWLDNVFGEYLRLQSDFACKFHTFIVYLALDFSVWILVAVTVDRCICVSAPFAARRWCTLKNARIVVFVILVVDFLINMHYFWTVDIIYKGTRTIAGDDQFTCYTSEDLGEAFFLEKVWPWLDFGVVCFVPFVIMLICNCLIIRQIVLSARNLRVHRLPKKSAAVSEHLPETSKKSFFSRSKSFVRRFRNRQIEVADVQTKKEADKNASGKDCCENSSVSAAQSSGNRASSETNQADRTVNQSCAARPATDQMMLMPNHSRVSSLTTQAETGRGGSCEWTLPTSGGTSSTPRNLSLRPGQDECSWPACADSSSGLEKDETCRQTHLTDGSEAEDQEASAASSIGQEIKKDPLLEQPASSPASNTPQDITKLDVSAPEPDYVINETAKGSGQGTAAPRMLQVHPPYRRQPPAWDTTRKRLGAAHSVTLMLLAVNTLFWLLTAPIVVFVIGYPYWLPGSSQQENARMALGWAVVNVLQYTNNTVHFFLYCLTGPRFREELIAMFRRVGSVRTLSTVK
ncbi:uncharacterized protein LOC112554822 [Pomacea canaliculata]|uniref:uncharacterized protein LOC112554822 n=1 Tax=Pomacea canaliculata TaxID=400727 RepID=UPI000D72D54E|nr:uncharacterized protein LOC112554822 [Pomacea canaliculata]